jgi:hypothetical protein
MVMLHVRCYARYSKNKTRIDSYKESLKILGCIKVRLGYEKGETAAEMNCLRLMMGTKENGSMKRML